jgi:CheY-like chemotaxis protein
MELITSNAEQQACEHIRPYQNTPSGLFAAFFDLSRTPFAASSQRGLVKSFFAQELKDVQAIIFQFLNGDIFVISTRLTMHHVLKAARHFGLDRYRNGKLYKLPHDYNEIAASLVKYVQAHEAAARRGAAQVTSARERFLDVKIGEGLPLALRKIRAARDDIKVLIIDDDSFALSLAQKSVGRHHDVETARTAVDGLKKYARIAPNILFLDIHMPGVSGYDFLEKIFEVDPDAFVVIISAHNDPNTIKKSQNLGARGFITKPYPREEIERYIQQCNAQGVDAI